MDQFDKLAEQFISGEISLSDLSEDQIDAVIIRTYEQAVALLDHEEFGEVYKNVADELQPLYEEIMSAGDEEFEKAIVAAEARGSTYWEIESSMLQ